MHDGSIQTGDTWLSMKLGAYAAWAKTNNSLLVVTFDEDNSLEGNHIATIFSGANVKNVQDGTLYNHHNLLRTIEDIYEVRSRFLGSIPFEPEAPAEPRRRKSARDSASASSI